MRFKKQDVLRILFSWLLKARRQQRKLNFLITQTELYAHFMARKMTGETDARRDSILSQLYDGNSPGMPHRKVDGGVLVDVAEDDYSKRFTFLTVRAKGACM